MEGTAKWPDPFPTYYGYEVTSTDDVWLLSGRKIVGETVKFIYNQSDICDITFELETELLDCSSKEIGDITNSDPEFTKQWKEIEEQVGVGHKATVVMKGQACIKTRTICVQWDQTRETTFTEGQYDEKEDFQILLSSDGNCMYTSCTDVSERGDKDAESLQGLLFRVKPADKLAPNLVKGSTIAAVSKKLDNALPILKANEDSFLDPDKEAPSELHYQVIINDVGEIQTISQTFHAKLAIKLAWKLTRGDCVNYIMEGAAWQPSWTPPRLQVLNMAKEGADSSVVVQNSSITLSEDNMANMTVTICGDFYEPLELQGFPFDIQPLKVQLMFEAGMESIALQESKKVNFKSIAGKDNYANWRVLENLVRVDCYPKTSPEPAEDHELRLSRKRVVLKEMECKIEVRVVVERNSTVLVIRVVGALFILQILTLSAFCLNHSENLNDRLGLTFTMVLTAVAYSLVLQNFLPEIGYLTFLDLYVLGTFLLLATITLSMVCSYEVEKHLVWEDFDWWVWFAMSAAVILFNLASAGWVAHKKWDNFGDPESVIDRQEGKQPECASTQPLEFEGTSGLRTPLLQ